MEKGIFRKTLSETLFLACTGLMRHTESHDMVRYLYTEGETDIFKHFTRLKKNTNTSKLPLAMANITLKILENYYRYLG